MGQKNRDVQTGEELIRLMDGGRADFTTFYADNFRQLMLVANKYVKSIPISEEIVQNIFLKIWEDKTQLYAVQSVKAYLYRSVVNAALNHLNREKTIEKHHIKLAGEIEDQELERLEEQQELLILLHQEINLLPEKCRQVFKLCRLEGKKYREIAAMLDISEKTVENHLSYGLKILRVRVLLKAKQQNLAGRTKYLMVMGFFLY